jgi:hypothetical protein
MSIKVNNEIFEKQYDAAKYVMQLAAAGTLVTIKRPIKIKQKHNLIKRLSVFSINTIRTRWF